MPFKAPQSKPVIEDFADLHEAYRSDEELSSIRRETSRLVPGFGASRPDIMIVGESPGAVDEAEGRPFLGPVGDTLRSLLEDVAEISLSRCYLTNIVKYRPPGGRKPNLRETLQSMDYLRAEWKLLGGPRVMVALGGPALNAIHFMPGGGITTWAGNPLYLGHGASATYLWPMIHPSHGLQHEKIRPVMERHWEYFGEWMREGDRL